MLDIDIAIKQLGSAKFCFPSGVFIYTYEKWIQKKKRLPFGLGVFSQPVSAEVWDSARQWGAKPTLHTLEVSFLLGRAVTLKFSSTLSLKSLANHIIISTLWFSIYKLGIMFSSFECHNTIFLEESLSFVSASKPLLHETNSRAY